MGKQLTLLSHYKSIIMSNKNKKNPGKIEINIPEGTNLNGDKKLERLERSLKELADYRYNLVTRCAEIQYPRSEWQRLDDFELNTLVRKLKQNGVTYASRSGVAVLLESNFSEEVNPIEEYFDKLPTFQGDPIGEMAATVTLVSDNENSEQARETFELFFKKWLVGAVANVYETDRCANQLCLIMAGAQGIFKSTWIRNLCPTALKSYYIEGGLDPDNKDSMLATTNNFIFNLDDYFAGLTAKKINEFKGLLTKNTVKVRRSYARYDEELPKICSFIASSNEAQFLHDPTGSRRFLPFELETIAIDSAQSISIDNLWSQARSLYRSGFVYWLTTEEQQRLTEYNSQFEVQSSEYELLVTYFKPPTEDEGTEVYLTNSEIMAHLRQDNAIKLTSRKLGEALKKAGFNRVQKRRGHCRTWVYPVCYLNADDIQAGRSSIISENNV